MQTTSATIAANTPGRRMIDHTRSRRRVARHRERDGVLVGELVRVGPQEHEREDRREADEHDRARGTDRSSGGSPARTASSPATGTSVGPMTDPMVAAHTTVPIADARRSVLTMSAAV